MHLFKVATLFIVLTLFGVEFCVSARYTQMKFRRLSFRGLATPIECLYPARFALTHARVIAGQGFQ